jgi:hypothetical protein
MALDAQALADAFAKAEGGASAGCGEGSLGEVFGLGFGHALVAAEISAFCHAWIMPRQPRTGERFRQKGASHWGFRVKIIR